MSDRKAARKEMMKSPARPFAAIFALAALAGPTPLFGQAAYPDPSGTFAVPGFVLMCLNTSNQAVACSSTSPMPTIGPAAGASVNLIGVNGTTVATGNGVTGAGSPRVTIASDNTPFTVNVGTSGLPTGAATAAKQPALGTAGTPSADVLTVQGASNMTPIKAEPAAAVTGGATPGHVLSDASTNATSVKGSAGTLYTLVAVNTNAATAYLKFYDKATAPTCNSDAVALTYPLIQNVPVSMSFGVGVAFPTGIGLCLTGAQADNDNTAATTGITVSLTYK